MPGCGRWVDEPGTYRAARLQRLGAAARGSHPLGAGPTGAARSIDGTVDPGCDGPAWDLRRRRCLSDGAHRASLGSKAHPAPADERARGLGADAASRVICNLLFSSEALPRRTPRPARVL